MSNVTDLFGAVEEETTQKQPVFTMEVKRKGFDPETVIGYPVVNQLFVAICKDDGVIQWLTPFDQIDTVRNLGEVQNPTVN